MNSPLVIPDAFLDIIIPAYFVANDVMVKLFCNAATPAKNSVLGDFTEADGGGYAPLTLTADSHTIETSAPHDISWGLKQFVFTGPLTTNPDVYGYYFVDAATELVFLGAQLLDEVFTPIINGAYVELNPCRLQYSSGVPA